MDAQENPPPERVPLPEGSSLRDGALTIGGVVGAGSFGITYHAWQAPHQFPVAVKEFFPEGCERQGGAVVPGPGWTPQTYAQYMSHFLYEGSVLERFHHPGIVRLLDTFAENGSSYLVMELLQGFTLAEGLQAAGPMSQSRILQVAREIGQALMVVHAAGLVHSDLKPENLYLTNEGHCVLLDFGTARNYLSSEHNHPETAALSVHYAPPEQYERNTLLTPAADVYALAATLHHLLSGHEPPNAHSRKQGKPLVSLHASNASVSPRIEEALLAALELDVRKRTPGIMELLEHMGVDVSPRASQSPTPEFHRVAGQQAHKGGTYVLALDAAGGRLYSGGRDGFLRCWSWPDLQLLHSVEAHRQQVNALAVSNDGGYLVSGSQRGDIKLWNRGLMGEPHTLLLAGPAVLQLAFQPGAGMLAGSFSDGSCGLLSPSMSEPISWGAHSGAVNGLSVHPSGRMLVTGGDDAQLRLWRVPSGQLDLTLSGHSKPVQSLHFSPDGELLLSASHDLSVRLWDVARGKAIREFRGHRALVWEAAFMGSGTRMIATTSSDRCVRAFRTESTRVVYTSVAHEGWTRALVCDPKQPLLATGGGDGYIRIWGY